jgi:arsenate reductase-like glutaredoxin family protein
MSYTKRNCDNCSTEYKADNRNLKRGWGLCCSKKCAAEMREKSKPGYDLEKVIKNNAQRKSFDVWLQLDKMKKEELINEEKRNLRDKRIDDLLK